MRREEEIYKGLSVSAGITDRNIKHTHAHAHTLDQVQSTLYIFHVFEYFFHLCLEIRTVTPVWSREQDVL